MAAVTGPKQTETYISNNRRSAYSNDGRNLDDPASSCVSDRQSTSSAGRKHQSGNATRRVPEWLVSRVKDRINQPQWMLLHHVAQPIRPAAPEAVSLTRVWAQIAETPRLTSFFGKHRKF